MTDLRALIAQLADELDHNRQCLLDDRRLTHPLADKARAALAEPEPEGPTDEDLFSLDQLRDKWNAQADAFNTWDELGIDEIVWWAQRQALARWGNRQEILDSSSQPIPVSKRLPGPGDCDTDGRCWWYGDGEDLVTHWLPAHAPPLPS
jgi:hypothetical protein